MDLFAYTQIDKFDKIAKDNGIEVPRLRGYRLMKDEEPGSLEYIKHFMKNSEVTACKLLCSSDPFWCSNPDYYEHSSKTDSILRYYLIEEVDEDGCSNYVGIRWDRIHGRKRKILKFEIKKQKRRIQKQYDMWNKYAGREDVLYIHSRIGGGNWKRYGGDELTKMPWFLDKVDDCFDETYCDIYALIKPEGSEQK